MLETCTRLSFSIPASFKASSNERSSSRWLPTPLVKKIFVGTRVSPSSTRRRSTSGKVVAALGPPGRVVSVVRFISRRSPLEGCIVPANSRMLPRGLRRRPGNADRDQEAPRLSRQAARAEIERDLTLDFLAFSRDVNRECVDGVQAGHC